MTVIYTARSSSLDDTSSSYIHHQPCTPLTRYILQPIPSTCSSILTTVPPKHAMQNTTITYPNQILPPLPSNQCVTWQTFPTGDRFDIIPSPSCSQSQIPRCSPEKLDSTLDSDSTKSHTPIFRLPSTVVSAQTKSNN